MTKTMTNARTVLDELLAAVVAAGLPEDDAHSAVVDVAGDLADAEESRAELTAELDELRTAIVAHRAAREQDAWWAADTRREEAERELAAVKATSSRLRAEASRLLRQRTIEVDCRDQEERLAEIERLRPTVEEARHRAETLQHELDTLVTLSLDPRMKDQGKHRLSKTVGEVLDAFDSGEVLS